jgi:hypothetical protein
MRRDSIPCPVREHALFISDQIKRDFWDTLDALMWQGQRGAYLERVIPQWITEFDRETVNLNRGEDV